MSPGLTDHLLELALLLGGRHRRIEEQHFLQIDPFAKSQSIIMGRLIEGLLFEPYPNDHMFFHENNQRVQPALLKASAGQQREIEAGTHFLIQDLPWQPDLLSFLLKAGRRVDVPELKIPDSGEAGRGYKSHTSCILCLVSRQRGVLRPALEVIACPLQDSGHHRVIREHERRQDLGQR